MKRIYAFVFMVYASVSLHAQNISEKMDALVAAYAKETGFNGVVMVAQKGNILFQKGYGYKNAEEKMNNDVQTIFQVGSITKQFTAALIMQLQQEKKLSVNDKLSKYYPSYPNGDKITIENLLTHTSGIFNYTNDTSLMKSDVTRSYSEKELVATFRDKPLSFEPGSKWEYSNSAYTLLGFIIQKVTKKPYEQVMRERILQPLQMANSGFDFTHLNNSNKAKGYFSLRPEKAMPAPVVDSTIAYAAGALYSTVDDLYKWERAIYTNKILMPESWKRTFTPLKNKYGYGWGIDTLYGKNYTAHSGGIHGFSSYLMRFPEDELAIIALSNSSSNVGKLTRNLAAVFYDQPYEITKAKEEIKIEPSALQQYTGVYKLAPNFSITITSEGSQLKAQATGQPIAEIYPQKENFFFYKVVDAQIEFQKDEKGAVTSLVLHQNGQQIKGEKIP